MRSLHELERSSVVANCRMNRERELAGSNGYTGQPAVTSMDAPNGASLRVLEKLGFRRCGQVPGAFGPIHVLERVAGHDRDYG